MKNAMQLGDLDDFLTVYVARVSAGCAKEPDDLMYVVRCGAPDDNREGFKRLNGGQTRFLSFFADPYGHLPTAIRVDRVTDSESLVAAREWLYIEAAGNKQSKSSIGFIADGAFAPEKVQLELISRIASLLFRDREYLAAMSWAQFEVLAVEMTQKGVSLVHHGWCEQTVFDKQLADFFKEIAQCLKHKRPMLSHQGIVQ
ncbi:MULTISPECIES: hypothetical protein [unclassified Neisseria]|uniref:hypothetical protein n=1 Tax=unclassified Neisseria TaxID=2623750 RepID=UPI002666CD0F|nr:MULTISPECIES: hypothetical protein [unclassified Neisseria]MDO1508771.1 hypothetical protein [Neisseria sp. MVDL19-042950]MDO1515030.1 hypothetical protein [Neisseria sp. MVDL18-041461]MDO1562390.1 hypothetical protein [Neisseria sp. MVDL20-010259]